MTLCGLERIPEHQDHRVSTQKHLGDESVLVDRLGLLLSLPSLWNLCPHFLHILQHHVTVPVKGLDTPQQLFVVAAVDEDLSVVLDRLSENRQRSSVELLLLLLRKLLLRQFTLWLLSQ